MTSPRHRSTADVGTNALPYFVDPASETGIAPAGSGTVAAPHGEPELLSLVVPFYNESDAIAVFFGTIIPALAALEGIHFEIICVNDGSTDDTLRKLLQHANADARIIVVDLTRNFGKEAALSAGIDTASGDILVPFDADLQDPPDVIARLISKWREGFDVVVAKRSDRSSDTTLKRQTAKVFYRLHNAVSELEIPDDVGDFRLFTREVADALRALPETQRFMKGLFVWVGYRTATIDYTRAKRAAGVSKFSMWKLWNFALEGFTSFGTLPLRIWTYLGISFAIFAFLYAISMVLGTLMFGVVVPGYASLLTVTLMLGGVQLIGIGVLGEYVGRIYFESKQRPIYLVRRRYRVGGDDI